ncbi:pyridoxamine 5'-phosphate oxidase family protein, partial [Eubacteriales bacterium OttesenSCG-928-N14]|nr:pyridoxamine 5'-phosphate oxidase family protein [Eubacteriales bacterium OttesenSCG-928-N14]
AIMYDGKIHFKTDKNFEKTKEILVNPHVAICKGGVSLRGSAINKGLVVDEPNRTFEKLYQQHLDGSYNAYSHVDTEILFEVTIHNLEIWDVDADNYAYLIRVNYDAKSATKELYDKKQ